MKISWIKIQSVEMHIAAVGFEVVAANEAVVDLAVAYDFAEDFAEDFADAEFELSRNALQKSF